MKNPVASKPFAFLLPVLLALPLSAGASSGGTAPEAKCGAIVNKAFSQAQSPIVRSVKKHILATCDTQSAAEFGPVVDERLDEIAIRANDAIERLGGIFVCDPQLTDGDPGNGEVPLIREDFIFFGTTEELLNTVFTPLCDGV